MHQKPNKRRKLLKQVAVYVVMTLAVFIIATFIILFVMGYRFNYSFGRIEQHAFLQYASRPSGATVIIDGNTLGPRTPTKSSTQSGQHDIIMRRDGYKDWTKTVNVKAGMITWLNYAVMVPEKLVVEPITKYQAIYSSLSSIKGRSILIQPSVSVPTFDLVDVSSDNVSTTKLEIPDSVYSESGTVGVKHSFEMENWDDGGRYVLMKHIYDGAEEWLVFDTQDVDRTKNITKTFNIKLSSIVFSGTSGNIFYVLDSTDIRKLDLSAGTISRPIVSNVKSFSLYESNTIAYVGIVSGGSVSQSVGIYRDGDSSPHVMRAIANKDEVLHIATARYFNEDYIVIAEGEKVDVLSGSYPSGANADTSSMKVVASFESESAIEKLSFSPTGEYVLLQSDADFSSYDLEYQTLSHATIGGSGLSFRLNWLDDNYLWSDRDGTLTIREFDGANLSTINSVAVGQDVLLTHNGRFLYSIDEIAAGYQLQRVRMILP